MVLTMAPVLFQSESSERCSDAAAGNDISDKCLLDFTVATATLSVASLLDIREVKGMVVIKECTHASLATVAATSRCRLSAVR